MGKGRGKVGKVERCKGGNNIIFHDHEVSLIGRDRDGGTRRAHKVARMDRAE